MDGDNTEKDAQIVVRMPITLRARLEKMAKCEYRSLSNQIRYLLEKSVEEYEQAKGRPRNLTPLKKTEREAS